MPNLPDFFKGFTPLLLSFSLGILLLAGGCSDEENDEGHKTAISTGCQSCHAVDIDQSHQFSCTKCHGGIEGRKDIEESHQGLIAQPAHPDNAPSFCGPCHADQLAMVSQSNHYTLTRHLDLVRNSFIPAEQHITIEDISSSTAPGTELQLVDDLLRRRCLRCHVYYQGDDFPLVTRATGCGACHLDYYDGQIVSHQFRRLPNDSRCLSCHYGNHVGSDYYGRFEHDFNEEYRTPYTTTEDFFRPYGVETHQLEPDIHRKGGMVCIDCHKQQEVMGAGPSATCESCHDRGQLQTNDNPSISYMNDQYLFTSSTTGSSLVLPVMVDPVHQKYAPLVSCHVCHALWTFDDEQTHLIRIDHDDLDDLEKLTLDGSSEVLQIVSSHMEFDGEWLDPVMKDKFTGVSFPGIWLKGYKQRRWENIRIEPDSEGILQVTRPILDLHLSWIDEDEISQFDNITRLPDKSGSIPYAPHTIGRAGPFYEKRLRHLDLENSNR